MSLIPFPQSITPERVSAELVRSDELFVSPVTGIQQAATRGNAYWRWTVRYRDLSDSERDIVQAFLLNCRGPLNSFKMPDFGHYNTTASASDWVDLFNDQGDFLNQSDVNSFSPGDKYNSTALSGGGVRIEKRFIGTTFALTKTPVNSFTAGATYLTRAKVINPVSNPMGVDFTVGSYYGNMHSPYVASDGAFSAPVFMDTGSAHHVSVLFAGLGEIGDYQDIHNFRIARAALVSNSENLLTRSNEFDHADWTSQNLNVTSGWSDKSPLGVTSGGWKCYGNSNTNTGHWMRISVTKPATEDIYSFFYYARKSELEKMRLRLDDGSSVNRFDVSFDLSDGTIISETITGDFTRLYSRTHDVGSDWLKISISGKTNATTSIRGYVYAVNSDDTVTYTSNGSAGVEIFGAQIRKHPYPGHYVPTVASAVVGSGWQTGSKLFVEGLSVNTVVANAGQRFEVITQYASSTQVEMSEFKRLTTDLISHREGWGIMEFDPPIRNAPEPFMSPLFLSFLGETMHNAVTFDRPEMKCRLIGNTINYTEKPLLLTDATFDVIEDLSE